MLKKVISIFINLILIITSSYCYIFQHFDNISREVSIILSIIPELLILLTIVFEWFNLKVFKKLFYCFFIISCVCLIGYTILYKTNLLSIFSNVHTLKEYILSTKEKGVIIYILIQLFQVVFLPIPASVICIVGSLIYGAFLGGIYCCIGVLVGSYISFLTGKVFGYKLVSWIVGKENVDKYSQIIRKRGGFFLGLAFLLPMFPDDILCFIAGITKISVKKFFWITLITRPIGVMCMAYFGSGQIIPFNNWGLYVWIAILVLVVIFTIVMYKWQEIIQEFILTKIFRKQNNKKIKLKEN